MSQDTTTMATRHAAPRDLGDGLIMRAATREDRERLADFHAITLLDIDQPGPDETLRAWMLDLMSGEHPTYKPGDFLLVEDTNNGKIVSSVGLFSQTWTYEGIPFPFGQPEIVSTDPDYRRRGLVRAQFDEIHRWSAARGELVQGITGIPWFYRQFGYDLALDLQGGRQGFKAYVPKLKEGESEPYVIRNATREDAPFFEEMYRRETSRSMIASVRDEALWRYDIDGRIANSDFTIALRIIETPEGKSVGVLAHSKRLREPNLNAYMYELIPGVPYLAVTPTVMRYLDRTGEEYAKQKPGSEFGAISFGLGAEHPVYDTISDKLPRVREPYAWYIRVPDLLAFLRHVTPALEKRLAESPQAGYTGELKINLFRSGLLLKLEDGKLSFEGWKPSRADEGDAGFPDLTFLQLLFGYRSLAELKHAFADCSATTDAPRALLPILFPKKTSHVWAGG